MSALTVTARYDGERIILDRPLDLQPDTRLLVTVLPEPDEERADWTRLALRSLERAYGPDEPDYDLASVRESNSEYAGR